MGSSSPRKQAQDAYFVEFEGSEMETAVRLHLGFARAAGLERKFRSVVPALKQVADGHRSPADDASHALLAALVEAARELNTKGVTDSSHMNDAATPAEIAADSNPTGDRAEQLNALRAGFERVRTLADTGDGDEAAAEMSSVYFEEFEPIERFVAVRRPQDVRPLEEAIQPDPQRGGSGHLEGRFPRWSSRFARHRGA